MRAVFQAAAGPAAGLGVVDQRAGALERVRFALADLARLRTEITVVQNRMVEVLDQRGLTELVGTIPGISVTGAATLLAQTGDPARFTSARSVVKHAGLCPRDNSSGTYQGKTGISGRGRPELRLAAWRVVFSALGHNPVLAARHAHLTGRAERPLTDTQARVALAAAVLRQLHAVVVTRTAWDPAIAAGLTRAEQGAATAA
ncbi:MAG TPA: IS110 family transposase [Pseudonocardia sp.]